MDEVEAKLNALKLKYPSNNPNMKNAVNLYLHIGGNTPKSRWIVFDKIPSFSFVKTSQIDSSEGKEDENDEESGDVVFNGWVKGPAIWAGRKPVNKSHAFKRTTMTEKMNQMPYGSQMSQSGTKTETSETGVRPATIRVT
ncbi:hypothetical protein LOK49_LG03G02572 [Camellia lanceoleosa]|uniref:Uncharacterized protein n=1 Tax=Camellia lanceoleosa TaxID=1840588 RepID=A0ACC0I646_9ERIC|nr:hypothetical protein LOK49_LG03G02572 [Camellia lanceoleosa]